MQYALNYSGTRYLSTENQNYPMSWWIPSYVFFYDSLIYNRYPKLTPLLSHFAGNSCARENHNSSYQVYEWEWSGDFPDGLYIRSCICKKIYNAMKSDLDWEVSHIFSLTIFERLVPRVRGKFSPFDAMSYVKFSKRPKMTKVGWLIGGLLEQVRAIARNPKMEPKGLVPWIHEVAAFRVITQDT